MKEQGSSLPIEADCASVKAKLDAGENFLLVDCREQDEYELVRIAGAKLVPMSEIQSRVGELLDFKDRNVVVHCHHGGRSLRVAAWLRQQGFDKAQSLAGGIDRWAQEIDPTLARY
ncbi:MAG TPA: rhodanese-like domain-containing protein [Pirellulales bacterium]|nr:rhodanese-like domain-containing protein [Pirellulales bacterium]